MHILISEHGVCACVCGVCVCVCGVYVCVYSHVKYACALEGSLVSVVVVVIS